MNWQHLELNYFNRPSTGLEAALTYERVSHQVAATVPHVSCEAVQCNSHWTLTTKGLNWKLTQIMISIVLNRCYCQTEIED